MTCPTSEYRTVSLGCFIEHDTAKACLRTSADVLWTYNCSDIVYAIPQTSLPESIIRELADRLVEMLLLEQFIGFFGVDIVVFYEAEVCQFIFLSPHSLI